MASEKLTETVRLLAGKFSKPNLLHLSNDYGEVVDRVKEKYNNVYLSTGKYKELYESKKYNDDSKVLSLVHFPMEKYDVVLVSEECFSFETVKSILSKNIVGESPFVIIFEGYGNNEYIRDFCSRNFPKNNVPIGEEGEAIICSFNEELKNKCLKGLER